MGGHPGRAGCPHTTIYDAADSGLEPIPWTVRAYGGRDLDGVVFRAHVGQCAAGCGARFVRVRTWTPGETPQLTESGWAVLAPPADQTAPGAGEGPGGAQAGFLAAVAAHLQAHPQLSEVEVHGRAGYRVLRMLADSDNDPAGLTAWARSFEVSALRAMAITDQTWSSVSFTARLGADEVRVWAPITGLPRDVTALTVTELAHFAEHGALPERGAGQ